MSCEINTVTFLGWRLPSASLTGPEHQSAGVRRNFGRICSPFELRQQQQLALRPQYFRDEPHLSRNREIQRD